MSNLQFANIPTILMLKKIEPILRVFWLMIILSHHLALGVMAFGAWCVASIRSCGYRTWFHNCNVVFIADLLAFAAYAYH